MKKQKLGKFEDNKEFTVFLISMILIFSVFSYAIYKSLYPPIKEITFKVFDVVEYSKTITQIHTYGKESFTLIGELDIEIIVNDLYYLKYREIGIRKYEVIKIMRLS